MLNGYQNYAVVYFPCMLHNATSYHRVLPFFFYNSAVALCLHATHVKTGCENPGGVLSQCASQNIRKLFICYGHFIDWC